MLILYRHHPEFRGGATQLRRRTKIQFREKP
jgi:hypothetical protein